jgi:Fe2+ or Zn2+ uptake regulation protein
VGSDDQRLDQLVEQLRAAGQRATTARRAVLAELLAAGESHRTADELARRIRTAHPAIHLSTVYRTLDSLTDAGLITVARFDDQRATYHLTDDVHHHAVCTSCGATITFGQHLLGPLRNRLLRDHGFHAEPHHLTIQGRCADCAGGQDETRR